MILNGKEVKTRHCPHCGKLLNKIYYEMDLIEYGNILHSESVTNQDDVVLIYDDSERNKNGKTYFNCVECLKTITEDIEEAKEFMLLKEESNE